MVTWISMYCLPSIVTLITDNSSFSRIASPGGKLSDKMMSPSCLWDEIFALQLLSSAFLTAK